MTDATAPADNLSVDLRVADPRWNDTLGDVEALAAHVLGHAARLAKARGEVSILMTTDGEMQDLNRQWRGLDKPTDVLSFPADAPAVPGQPRPLGDIAIGYETSMRDANAMSRAAEAHVSHLMVHGFLHLLGYDHMTPEDASRMEPFEAEILAGLGWSDPYAATVDEVEREES